jgi:outer membrane protein assembly factor BamD
MPCLLAGHFFYTATKFNFVTPLRHLKKYLFLLIPVFILVSCDGYNRLLKSSNYELKLQRAGEYYAKGNYIRAIELYGELIPIYKGSDKAEEIYYFYTWCNFYQGDYSLSQYHFKNFTRQFPGSSHTEECYFMNAYCYYLTSPNYKLDQTDTKAAIKEFQSFIDSYPESKRLDTCNLIVDELRGKLENKDYDIVKQYSKLGEYKAVITSAKGFIKEFPDSKYVEEMFYLTINSYYTLALNSIPAKKLERLNGAIECYLKFVDLYPKSNYLGKAESVYTSCVEIKEKKFKGQ